MHCALMSTTKCLLKSRCNVNQFLLLSMFKSTIYTYLRSRRDGAARLETLGLQTADDGVFCYWKRCNLKLVSVIM